jgi:hypothetical protein
LKDKVRAKVQEARARRQEAQAQGEEQAGAAGAMEGGMAGAAGAAAMAQSRGGGGSTGDVEDGGVEMTTTAGEKDGGENKEGAEEETGGLPTPPDVGVDGLPLPPPELVEKAAAFAKLHENKEVRSAVMSHHVARVCVWRICSVPFAHPSQLSTSTHDVFFSNPFAFLCFFLFFSSRCAVAASDAQPGIPATTFCILQLLAHCSYLSQVN